MAMSDKIKEVGDNIKLPGGSAVATPTVIVCDETLPPDTMLAAITEKVDVLGGTQTLQTLFDQTPPLPTLYPLMTVRALIVQGIFQSLRRS